MIYRQTFHVYTESEYDPLTADNIKELLESSEAYVFVRETDREVADDEDM